MPGIGVAGERRKVRTGTEASFQLCRLPVRPRVRSGPTHTGPVTKPSGKNTETSIPTGLSGPGVHFLDRSINSHRKGGLFLLLIGLNSSLPQSRSICKKKGGGGNQPSALRVFDLRVQVWRNC